MGFPVGYSELPKLILHLLFLLYHIRKLITITLHSLGLETESQSHYNYNNNNNQQSHNSVLSETMQQTMPVTKYKELQLNANSLHESCAVCLHEFEGTDSVRRMRNCCHVFHQLCVDRWVEHGQWTCPLCRSPFIDEDSLCSVGFHPDEYLCYSFASPSVSILRP